ncbi:ABC-2 family transporter protein [uncultured Clostridium sp.]|uniref:ABC transporter permease n=1 Tax=uncultured Clostridium sp. TaxID=59620 RepID=UPI002608A584|nr:ABC-2 family transporter protein [uncultured Clostridium sp.]
MNFYKKNKIYLAFSMGSLKRSMAYNANIFLGTIGNIIIVSVTFFLWKAIYSSSSKGIMKGFTLNDMLIYVMITFVIGIITSSNCTMVVRGEVWDGSIAMELIKPINYRKRIMFMSFGGFLFNFIFLFLPGFIIVTAYSFYKGMHIGIIQIVLFFISMFLGFLINSFYSYMFGLLAFKFYNVWGLSQIANAIVMLISGALIPLTFFPSIVEKIFSLLPFSSIIYTPAMIYLGKYDAIYALKMIVLQVIWVFIMSVLSKLIWNRLAYKLTIQGG